MISVITITYNRAAILTHTIDSVLNQTYGEIEYIIVDDGSTDDTESVCASYKQNDARLSYIKVPHVANLAILRNTGLRAANGEFVAYIDSDDTWHKDFLSASLQHLTSDANAGYTVTDARVKISDNSTPDYSLRRQILYKNYAPYTHSIVFRKKLLHTMGYHDEEMVAGDLDFFTRMTFHCKGIFFPGNYCNVGKSPDSFSTIDENQGFAERIVTLHKLKAKFITEAEYKKAMAEVYKHFGYHHMSKGHPALASMLLRLCLTHGGFQPIVFARLILCNLRRIF